MDERPCGQWCLNTPAGHCGDRCIEDVLEDPEWKNRGPIRQPQDDDGD